MRRFTAILALGLALTAHAATAIQLHWSSGASALSFSSATRCTLVVEADSGQALPAEWRLLWVADTSAVQFTAIDPSLACQGISAQVSEINPPTNAADSAANAITAHFCSAEGGTAATAQYLIDLPGGARGKTKVVALDPADSTSVLQSPEVTFNGGVDVEYPPAILHASSIHRSTAFQLNVVGAGLASTRAISLVAPDASWRLSLEIASRGDTAISGTASLAANVPACLVEAQTDAGGVASVSLAADPSTPPLEPQSGCQGHFAETIYPLDMIQPKDFAFVPGGWTPWGSWTFHLFYIRQNQETKKWVQLHGGIDFTEKNIGHAVSSNLNDWWVADTAAVRTRGGRFDSLHVWAPTVVQRGLTYYLFYTGVDQNQKQRIGLATSTDLVTWVQGDSVLQVSAPGTGQIPWADPSPQGPYGGQTQLRDPFVMEDPDALGNWLMYFVTVSRQYSPQMVVGVAKSAGNFESWGNSFPLWNTAFPYPAVTETTAVESPHAFWRDGKWRLFYTVDHDSIWAGSNAYAPIDTASAGARWDPVTKLRDLVPAAEAGTYNFWHASEYLEFAHPGSDTIAYLAAYDDAAQGISYTRMGSAPPYLFTALCPSDSAAGVEAVATGRSPRLQLIGRCPARSRVGLRVELPARMWVRLAIYDVLGRRVKALVDGEFPAGATDLSWDGHDEGGFTVGSGVYFASLTMGGRRQSLRVPLIR